MKSEYTIYHGSQKIVEVPMYGMGNPRNDYGLGFYCTESIELAKEWACTEEESGYANRYGFNMDGLSVMNLANHNYHILNWLSILLKNRIFKISNPLAAEAKEYITEEFLPAYEQFDVIIGYRADDSYFSFANAFLNNTISLQQLEEAMYLGKLGEQIVLKSQKAFEHIKHQDSIIAEKEIYYPQKTARDAEARTIYQNECRKRHITKGVYMLDILREEWKNHDSRIRRNVPK